MIISFNPLDVNLHVGLPVNSQISQVTRFFFFFFFLLNSDVKKDK